MGLLEHPVTKSGVTDSMLAIERFETVLGVYDHDKANPNNPYPISIHNQISNSTRDSLASREIHKLIRYRIPQMTGMSLTELLDLPTSMYKQVVYACQVQIKRKGDMVDEMDEVLDGLDPTP